MMSTAWILVANSSHARLFETSNTKNLRHKKTKFELLQEFNHPESRMKDEEIVSDRLGRYKGRTEGTGGAFVEPTEPRVHEQEKFALELVETLEKGRVDNRYQELILVSPPHFLGMLNKHINGNLDRLITTNIKKDYTKDKEKDLIARLEKQLMEEE